MEISPSRRLALGAVMVGLGFVLLSCGGGSGGGTGSLPVCPAGQTLVGNACQPTPAPGPTVQAWLSTADQSKKLARDSDLFFANAAPASVNIDVDPTVRYQDMVGFGAALTDASAYLIQNKLSDAQRTALLQDLFGRNGGIGLSFTRVSIGASDFSRTHYTLDDVPAGQTDPSLAAFSIAPVRADLLPTLKSAQAINAQLRVMATPWSAPAWMKTNGSLVHSPDPNVQGTLRADAYAAFAQYLGKYADAMQAEGVPLYALSMQNEPAYEPADYPGMLLAPSARATLLAQHVGPLFTKRPQSVKLLDWDHNWDQPSNPLAVLGDAAARPYVAGVAWHCYAGDVSAQTPVHNAYPDKEAYFTECSGGDWANVWGDNLLWNVRQLVIGSTRNWAKGVLLWNLALDEKSGPHLGGCTNCRGVVTIQSQTGEVTRNVEYYALAHASRFVRPGAQRIDSATGVSGLDTVAFRNTDDGSLVLIVANGSGASRSFTVRQAGQTVVYQMASGSVATLMWTPA